MKTTAKKNKQGFTLIELLITVSIVTIFASIAVPSYGRWIESNRISTAANELVSGLIVARSESLKRSASVTICASDNQTSCSGTNNFSEGWIIFMDCNNNGVPNGSVAGCGSNNQEEIIKVNEGFEKITMETISTGAPKFITFRHTGRPGQTITFTVGDKDGNAMKNVSVNRVGRIKTERV